MLVMETVMRGTLEMQMAQQHDANGSLTSSNYKKRLAPQRNTELWTQQNCQQVEEPDVCFLWRVRFPGLYFNSINDQIWTSVSCRVLIIELSYVLLWMWCSNFHRSIAVHPFACPCLCYTAFSFWDSINNVKNVGNSHKQ